MQGIENEIIVLRAPEPSDVDILYIWENNIDTWLTGTTLTPFSKFILAKYLETAHLDIFETKQLRLMIDLKPEKRTIGAIDVFDFDTYNNRAGVGILIAEKSDRNKGYASKSLELLINYCFNIIGLNQLYCNISKENSESLRLFKHHGFETVGLKKKWTRRGKTFEDEYLLQLINTNI